MSDVAVSLDAGWSHRLRNGVLWVLQIAVGVAFVLAGSAKLLGAAKMVAAFELIGLGQWFRYLTGSLEIIGAVGLFTPRWSALGASLLVCVMVGAVTTHLVVLGGSPAPAAILGVLSLVVAVGRHNQLRPWLSRVLP